MTEYIHCSECGATSDFRAADVQTLKQEISHWRQGAAMAKEAANVFREVSAGYKAKLDAANKEIERLRVWSSDSHVTQLESKLADMTADRDSWQKQASDRLNDANTWGRERDEALAKLAADQEMFLAEHDENVRLHTQVEELQTKLDCAETIIQRVYDVGDNSCYDLAKEYLSKRDISMEIKVDGFRELRQVPDTPTPCQACLFYGSECIVCKDKRLAQTEKGCARE